MSAKFVGGKEPHPNIDTACALAQSGDLRMLDKVAFELGFEEFNLQMGGHKTRYGSAIGNARRPYVACVLTEKLVYLWCTYTGQFRGRLGSRIHWDQGPRPRLDN